MKILKNGYSFQKELVYSAGKKKLESFIQSNNFKQFKDIAKSTNLSSLRVQEIIAKELAHESNFQFKALSIDTLEQYQANTVIKSPGSVDDICKSLTTASTLTNSDLEKTNYIQVVYYLCYGKRSDKKCQIYFSPDITDYIKLRTKKPCNKVSTTNIVINLRKILSKVIVQSNNSEIRANNLLEEKFELENKIDSLEQQIIELKKQNRNLTKKDVKKKFTKCRTPHPTFFNAKRKRT